MTSTNPPALDRSRPEGWWAYPPVYAVATYLASFVPGLPWWAFVLIGAAAALFGALAAHHVFDWAVYGPGFCSSATWCAGLAGVGATAWLAAADLAGPLVVWQWLAVWLAVFGGWYCVLIWQAPRAAAVQDLRPAPAGDVPVEPEVGAPYPEILRRAGVTGVRVVRVETSPSGGVDTIHLQVEPAPGSKAMKFPTFKGLVGDIAVAAAPVMRGARGIELQENDVLVEEGGAADRFLMHVTVKRVLLGTIPYRVRTVPREHGAPLLLGQYEDDRPIELTMCHAERGAAHADVLGATESGKTTLANVIIGETISAEVEEVWIVALDKLTPLVYPWLVPWIEGRTDRPAIDRVCGPSIVDALDGLAEALQFAVLSNSQLGREAYRRPSVGKAGLTLMLEESSLLMQHPKKVHTVLGEMNASQIVAEIERCARTAPVSVIKLSQFGLYHTAGSAGAEQKRNTTIGIALKVQRRQDATSVLPALPGSVDATKLTDNMMFVQANTETSRVMRGKGPALLSRLVPDVAAAYTGWRHGLDPAVTRQLPTYADRWAPARHPDLVRIARSEDHAWPGAPAGAHPGDTRAPARPSPGPSPAEPPAQEAPMSPAEHTDFDMWAAELAAGDAPAPAGGGMLPASDTSGIEAAGRRVIEAFRRKTPVVPEPLSSVLAALAAPGAPTEWVPTEVLATVIGRVAPDADAEAKRKAAEQLGLDLTRQCPGLKSTQRRTGGGGRPRGYEVAALKEAAARLG